MNLTSEEQAMLDGKDGPAVQKAMRILVALGTIYQAENLIPVTSVQVSGVSYDNLGEAGLAFLAEMADGGGRARVLTTLNPAGMDLENWPALGISPAFAAQQTRVIEAFTCMGVNTTCTCTPYLAGNTPSLGDTIAWAESSAVAYADSILGAHSNREGGPSALAASLTGLTPAYGLHLSVNRQPGLTFTLESPLAGTYAYGALGKVIGQALEALNQKPVPYIQGITNPTIEELKSFCASMATYGGVALFHIPGVTPEAAALPPLGETIPITASQIEQAMASLSNATAEEVDFYSLGCPHLTIQEIARVAQLLENKHVKHEFWITTSRPVRQMAEALGYVRIIEASGAKFATDTCCVVAPIQGRFHALATDSAKACYYAYAKNKEKTRLLPFDQVVLEALQ